MTGPYWGTYGIVYRVLQSLLQTLISRLSSSDATNAAWMPRTSASDARATSEATSLELLHDLPDADIAPPEPPGGRKGQMLLVRSDALSSDVTKASTS